LRTVLNCRFGTQVQDYNRNYNDVESAMSNDSCFSRLSFSTDIEKPVHSSDHY